MFLPNILLVSVLSAGMTNGADIANSQSDMFMCMRVGQLVAGSCPETERRLTALEQEVEIVKQELMCGSNNNRSLAKDCYELYERGYTTDGEYKISPDGRRPFSAYCDFTNGGWTVIQKRFDGNINFRRNWEEYAEGFGDLSGEHWLGLDNIHRLTKDSSEIHFALQHSSNDSWVTAHYKAFTVHDASSRYRMNVNTYSYESDIGEWLGYHDGKMFSTYDRDNDDNNESCSKKYGEGGWWYNSCYRLGNLNGLYRVEGSKGMNYWTTVGNEIKSSTVKVKPRYT